MRGKDISDALGSVEGRFIEESAEVEKKNLRWLKWTAPVAAALVIALVLGLFFKEDKQPCQPRPSSVTDLSGIPEGPLLDPEELQKYTVAAAVYPVMTKLSDSDEHMEETYEAWRADRQKQLDHRGAGTGLTGFFTAATVELLTGTGDNNRVYSPLNIYMALSMLAQITDGNSRDQILKLLGAEDVQTLQEQVDKVWNANYFDDGSVTSIPANSLWLNDRFRFNRQTLQLLADKYHASSFSGKMGSEKYTSALQSWMNEQTGGLLKGQIGGLKTDPDDVIDLVSTLYFKAGWHRKFSSANTKKDSFHGSAGDVDCDFMHADKYEGIFVKGDGFTGALLPLENSGNVLFMLPEEGISPEQLLDNQSALLCLLTDGKQGVDTKKSCHINLTIPKFDVTSQLDLRDGLKNLGVTDCFHDRLADFTPLPENSEDAKGLVVGRVQHGARIKIEEKGVEGAAYTFISVEATGFRQTDTVVFTVDRPFAFAVTGSDGLPLFVGIINNL